MNVELLKELGNQIDGSHYQDMVIQPWEIIEKNRLDYFEGAALKYLLRWQKKGGIKDIKKLIDSAEKILKLAEAGHYGDLKNEIKSNKQAGCIVGKVSKGKSGGQV